MLDIRLLGTPRIFLNKKQITVQRKTTRSLLFYLAMHPNGVRRSQLREIMWGALEDEAKQSKNLRRYLNFVRNILPDDELIETYHGNIRLNPALVKVDALIFLETAEKVQKSKGSFHDDGRTIPFGLYQDALDAVALLDGDTFIDSIAMDKIDALIQWKNIENSRVRNARNTLFAFLADIDSRQGNPEKALLWAERALELDVSDEAHYLVLKSLRELGELEKARKYYLDLTEDFGDVISQKLRLLGEEILNIGEASPNYVRPVWGVRPSASIPFVGHTDLLLRMKMNYQRGIGTLIVGETGAGKTRLAQQFYETLPLPPNLLLVPCYRDNENLPYQPWIDMLRYGFRKEFWQTTPAWWTTPLTMLLPELHEYRDDLDAKRGDVFATALIFEAFKNLLTHANQKRAGLLFVEDSQWMDRVSFALLKYLILQSTFKPWNIGLVVTSRLGIHSGVERFEFDAMLGKMDEIEIAPLEQEDIKHLVFYLLQERLPDEKIARLKKMTGGNPFFLLEILGFQASRADVDIFKAFAAAPPSIRQLIAARLDSLSSRARKVLNYAAIQGNHFVLSILEEVLSLPVEEMNSVITELQAVRLVHFLKSDGDLHYAFAQEKLREEVVNALSQVDLRLMHAQISKVLSQKNIYQDELAAVLAEHYEGAGELQKAFFAWNAAAKHAYRIFSHRDAHSAYQRAERLLTRIVMKDEAIYEFYTTWGVMLFNSDKPDELEVVMQNLLALGEKLSSSLLIGTALDGLSDVHMARNQFEKGLDRIEEALTYLITGGHVPAQMNAFIHQGVFLYMLSNFPAAVDSFNTVLSLGKNRSDPVSVHALGGANYQMAASLTGMGYPLDAIRYAKESLHIMRLSNVPHSSILPHSIMGLANYYLGLYDEGKQHALTSLKLAKKTDSWRMVGYATAYAGMNETELPELGLAWEHAQQAIQHGEEHGHTEIVSMGYKILGDIYARLDAPIQAAKFYQRGVAVDKGSFAKLENAARLGVTLGLLGDPRADAALEEALFQVKAAGLETIELNAKALRLSLFVAHQEYAAFDANVVEISTALTERSHPKSFVWTDYLQAVRLFQEAQYEEALILLEKNIPFLEEIPFFWIRLRAYKLQITLLKALGRNFAPIQTKLAEMLEIIEAGLGDAPLEEEWQVFSERTKAL